MYRIALIILFLINTSNVIAAECLDVFPSSLNQLTPINEQLINFPPNSSSASLTGGTSLPRGDNYYGSSGLLSFEEVYVAPITGSETTTRLFFTDAVAWQDVKINENGNPEDLIIVVNGSLSIYGDSIINAIIYVKGSLILYGNGTINGTTNSNGSTLNLGYNINYNSSYISDADFNGMCDIAPPAILIADYHFDECTYTGSGFEVIDQTGNFSATSHGGVSTFSQGQIERGAALTDEDHHFQTSIPMPSSFSVSTWFKKPTSNSGNVYFVLGAMELGGDLLFVKRDLNWRWGVHNRFTGDHYGSYSFNALDNDWHHMALVYTGGQTKLYIDSVHIDTVDYVPSGTLKYIGTSYDDISSSNQQGFRAPLDEFMIFDGVLSPTKISELYNHQLSKNNYDGSTRQAVSCSTVLANYRFDECSYTGSGFEVIDQTGNYSAITKGGVNTFNNGKVERGAELISENQHFETSISLTNDFSVSTWFKVPTSNSDNRYFILGAFEGGGDLLYLDRNNSWTWGVYSPGAGSFSGTYSFEDLGTNWHHMALVYSGGQTKLYIDGALKDTVNTVPSGTLKYIGTSYDQVNSSSPQAFRAPLDEFIVFDGALTEDTIVDIFNNQSAGYNYDGSSRDAVICDDLLGFYQFEQNDFINQVDDSSNYDNHGTNIGGLSVEQGRYCRGFDTNGTNQGSQTNNAFSSNIDLDDDIGLKGSISFWYRSNTDWNKGGYNGTGEKTLFDASTTVSNKYFTLEIQSNGLLRFSFEDTVDGDYDIEEPSGVIRSADTWYYISVIWDYESNRFQLYVDGNSLVDAVQNTNGNIRDLGPVIFGDNSSTYGQNNNHDIASYTSANGKFDEIRLYKKVLSQVEIQTDMNESLGCEVIDHFEINHDGQGLTCEAESITIKACADATCSILSNDAVDVNLSINGTFDKTVTVIGGSTTTNFSHLTPDTVTLSLDDTYQCKNGGSSSCDVIFADAGFKFLYGTAESETIGNQISGNDFVNILKLQAVENVNGVCEGLFSGNNDVELSQLNVLPTGISGQKMMVDGTPIAKHPAFTPNITLNFGSDSKAVIPLPTYLDAGQIRLQAKYSEGGVNLVGSSNNFWVSPYKLVINARSGGANIDGNSASSITKHKAGQPFDLSVTAYNSQGTNATNITMNYVPENIQLLLTRIGPSVDGFDGNFNYGTGTIPSAISPLYQSVTLSAFSGGVSVANNASYSEVGLLSLDIQDVNYGFTGNVINGGAINGDAINIGRFYPDHFDIAITSNSFGDTCTTGAAATDFTYIGQPFSYFNAPELLITAKNLSGVITKNYTEPNYQKLTAADIERTYPIVDTSKNGADNTTKMAISAVTNVGNLVKSTEGVLKFTFSTLDTFTYTKNDNSQSTPFTMEYDIVIDKIRDIDGANASNYLASNIPTTNTVSPMGVNLRFGRLYVENTFGPETSSLPLPMFTQYWDGSRFLVNTLDNNCTTFDAANLTIDDTALNPGTTKAVGSGVFANGETLNVIFSAPGTSNQGAVPVIYNTLSMPWLLYDWSWNGTDPKVHDENPSATVTFGQYRGNDRIIYQREIHQ